MNQNDYNYFSAALQICIGEIKNGTEVKNAIEKTVALLGATVSDVDELRNYLYENISFSSNDTASMLSTEDRKDRE